MPRHQQTLAIAAIVVLLAVFAYLAVRHNEAIGRASTSTTSLPDQQYVSTTYGFSFSYPPQYSLTEYTAEDVSLSDPQTGDALTGISVETNQGGASFKSFDDFAVNQASLLCDANGIDGSAQCPGVSRSAPFTTKTGVAGTVYYLEYVLVSAGATTTSEAGPFYAFDISGNAPADAYQVLLIRPAHFAEVGSIYDVGVSLAQMIMNSLKTTVPAQ